jgi:hypothetical protein
LLPHPNNPRIGDLDDVSYLHLLVLPNVILKQQSKPSRLLLPRRKRTQQFQPLKQQLHKSSNHLHLPKILPRLLLTLGGRKSNLAPIVNNRGREMYISKPTNRGRVFIARHSTKGNFYLIWSFISVEPLGNEVRIDSREVPRVIKRKAYQTLSPSRQQH